MTPVQSQPRPLSFQEIRMLSIRYAQEKISQDEKRFQRTLDAPPTEAQMRLYHAKTKSFALKERR